MHEQFSLQSLRSVSSSKAFEQFFKYIFLSLYSFHRLRVCISRCNYSQKSFALSDKKFLLSDQLAKFRHKAKQLCFSRFDSGINVVKNGVKAGKTNINSGKPMNRNDGNWKQSPAGARNIRVSWRAPLWSARRANQKWSARLCEKEFVSAFWICWGCLEKHAQTEHRVTYFRFIAC